MNFREVLNLTCTLKTDLLILPELFATGYTFASKEETTEMGEFPGEETTHFLQLLSGKTGGIVVAGFVEKEGDTIYNSAMIVADSEIIGIYRKLHLFNKEKLWFSPGNKPPKVYRVRGVNIGIMICFDWIFPEVTRSLALQGAQIIAHPSNLVMPHCQAAMVTRCIENRVFSITANRIGTEKRGEDEFIFTGMSQITSTRGEILSSAPGDKTYVGIARIDPFQALNKKINPYNDLLADRRIQGNLLID
ncbi:MAG: acyltransferase [Bacteroidetes bacterium]|nr:acyltransferase [Bacteroidota bacterium]